MAFLRERLGIFLANGFNRRDLFKVSTARYGVDVLSHPWLKEADVVCLNWINQGMLSLSAIRAIADMGKKIIWTMHDMCVIMPMIAITMSGSVAIALLCACRILPTSHAAHGSENVGCTPLPISILWR